MTREPPTERRVDPVAVREAFTLPLIFLTVSLAGGVRIGADSAQLSFAPPPLMALVLAVMLVGTLFRAGVLAPRLLVDGSRRPIENLSGIVVVVTLFAAAAQVFNAVTPEAGLLAFVFNFVFLVLLGNTMVARPDRGRLLASLLVVFGAAFVAKFVVLGALYVRDGGLTRRVVLALLDGVTLGTLAYETPATATGYVAFFTVLGFLIGLTLLPHRRPILESSLVVAEPIE